MLLAVVMGLLLVASIVAFVVPLRIAKRNETAARAGGRPYADGTSFVGLDHLEIGCELRFDGQRWFVRGVQHVTPPGGEPWSAWHLDDRGQGGWLQTAGRDDEVVFAIRAEHPDTLDPTARELVWRDHDWVRLQHDGGPVEATGDRRPSRRGELGPVSPTDVERVVFTREAMTSRRLVLERSADQDGWNAWIGTAVPGRLVDVWPPAGVGAAGGSGPTDASPGSAVSPGAGAASPDATAPVRPAGPTSGAEPSRPAQPS
jgi:hypothetical protein